MNPKLLAAVGLVYLWVAYNYGRPRTGMVIVFIGYAIANLGLIIDALQHKA